MMRLRGEGEGEKRWLVVASLSRLTALYKRHKKGGWGRTRGSLREKSEDDNTEKKTSNSKTVVSLSCLSGWVGGGDEGHVRERDRE